MVNQQVLDKKPQIDALTETQSGVAAATRGRG
jgi:hypothetical protein